MRDHCDGLSDNLKHPGQQSDGDLGCQARRAQAMEALLVQKGICTREEVQGQVDETEAKSPADGARVVDRAWVNPDFQARLLEDSNSALAEFGYSPPETIPLLAVVENNFQVHHLVICTLCSYYPRVLLSRPPDWYKSLAYRSQAVIDPRGVMQESGLNLDNTMEVKVLNSTADLRYLVLPRWPIGTGNMSEQELAELVTRDSMIGVTEARIPEPALPR